MFEKSVKAVPSSAKPDANCPKLLSPNIIDDKDSPSFGISLANPIIPFAASTPFSTFSTTIPAQLFEKSTNADPKSAKPEAKSAILFSPANKDNSPPSLGIVAAISAKVLAASAAAVIVSGFMFAVFSPNAANPSPKAASFVPKVSKSPPCPNVRKDTIPLTTSAAVMIRIAFAKFVMLSPIDGSILFAPSINGCKLVMKSDNWVAKSGRPEPIFPMNPPIIFPKNEPIPYPIFSRTAIPLSKNSSHCGTYVINAPMAIIKPPIIAIMASNAPAPAIAAGATAPTPANIKDTADIANNKVDNAKAVSIDG